MEFEDSFDIFSNGKLIIGVENGKNSNTVIIEDITDHNSYFSRFGDGTSTIYTIMLCPESKNVLLGDSTGRVIQYHQQGPSKTWTCARDYGKILVGLLRTAKRFKSLVIFGGNNSYIRAIDIKRREMFIGPLKTIFKHVNSVQFCKVSVSEVLLVASGKVPDLSSGFSDTWDVGSLLRFHRVPVESESFEIEQKKRRVKVKEENYQGSIIKDEDNESGTQELENSIELKSNNKCKSIDKTIRVIKNQDKYDQSQIFDQVKKVKESLKSNGHKLYQKIMDSVSFEKSDDQKEINFVNIEKVSINNLDEPFCFDFPESLTEKRLILERIEHVEIQIEMIKKIILRMDTGGNSQEMLISGKLDEEARFKKPTPTEKKQDILDFDFSKMTSESESMSQSVPSETES